MCVVCPAACVFNVATCSPGRASKCWCSRLSCDATRCSGHLNLICSCRFAFSCPSSTRRQHYPVSLLAVALHLLLSGGLAGGTFVLRAASLFKRVECTCGCRRMLAGVCWYGRIMQKLAVHLLAVRCLLTQVLTVSLVWVCVLTVSEQHGACTSSAQCLHGTLAPVRRQQG